MGTNEINKYARFKFLLVDACGSLFMRCPDGCALRPGGMDTDETMKFCPKCKEKELVSLSDVEVAHQGGNSVCTMSCSCCRSKAQAEQPVTNNGNMVIMATTIGTLNWGLYLTAAFCRLVKDNPRVPIRTIASEHLQRAAKHLAEEKLRADGKLSTAEGQLEYSEFLKRGPFSFEVVVNGVQPELQDWHLGYSCNEK